jgi:hypothetical protein
MNRKPDHPEADRPQPREAYGHPVTTGVKYRFSDHGPGHDDSPAPVQGAPVSGEYSRSALIPPHNAAKVPKTSLAERIRQGLAAKEQRK